MQEFLVMTRNCPLDGDEMYVVLASSQEEALTKYLRQVIALSDLHREFVSNLSINVSFAEKFYLASAQEVERFTSTGENGTAPEVVQSRVRRFFSSRPDLGEAYLKYMETEDPALLSEDLFEFTALQLSLGEHGLCAIPLESLPVLE